METEIRDKWKTCCAKFRRWEESLDDCSYEAIESGSKLEFFDFFVNGIHYQYCPFCGMEIGKYPPAIETYVVRAHTMRNIRDVTNGAYNLLAKKINRNEEEEALFRKALAIKSYRRRYLTPELTNRTIIIEKWQKRTGVDYPKGEMLCVELRKARPGEKYSDKK